MCNSDDYSTILLNILEQRYNVRVKLSRTDAHIYTHAPNKYVSSTLCYCNAHACINIYDSETVHNWGIKIKSNGSINQGFFIDFFCSCII